jgi:cyclopropane-fatty-acyl-phospholipid synthase
MDRLLAAVLSRLVTKGTLTVVTASRRRLTFGDGSEQPVVVRFADRRAQWAFLLDPDLRLGEIFTDGRLVVEQGSIYDFLRLVLREAKDMRPGPAARALDRVRYTLRRMMLRTGKGHSKDNAAHHYDRDGRIYDWMLDEDKQYTCAYFEHPGMTLEDAQLAKKRHLTAKLLVEPGHSVVDIGSGWGGFAIYLAEVAQAGKVVGVNLSDEQVKSARQRVASRGLENIISFQIQDYRDAQGKFDRVTSVGMLEHVGPSHYDTYFKTVARLMKDDGVALIHTIGCGDGVNFPNPWLNKYIFPSGYLPALSELTPAIEKAGLITTDVEIWRMHYAPTLRAWRERFLAHRDEAANLYSERFCRMWEYYLSMAETAFQYEDVVVFQIQAVKQIDAVPLTRAYIAEREDRLRAAEGNRAKSPALRNLAVI